MLPTSGRLAGVPGPDRLAAMLLGGTAVGLTAAQQGGYFPPAWGWSALGLLLAAALALAFRDRVELTRLEWGFLGGLAAVLLWIALSSVWSASAPRTVDELERAIVYAAALASLFALVTRESLPYLLGGLLAAVGAVSAYALVDGVTGPAEAGNLSGPLGYWNALGILSAIGLILALGLASTQLPRGVRLGVTASLPLLATTLYFTHSRGALLALGAGLFAFVFLHPLLAGRGRRAAAVGALVLALTALGIGLARAGGPGALLGRTYGAFRAPPAVQGKRNETLLTLSGNNRSAYWRIAWRQYRAHPWLGSGAGTFELYWNRNRNTIYGSRDAHNLYLETLAELGPIGLLLLVGTLALPLLALPAVSRDPLRAAAAGAYLAFLLHAAVDWDWEMPAVTLAGLLCGGGLIVLVRARQRPVSGAGRAVALGALAIVAAFTAVAYRGNLAAKASVEAAARGNSRRAESSARTVTRWNPWSSEGWRLLGEAKLALGDEPGARMSFRTGLGKDPRDWKLWYDLAVASEGPERERALAEALRLNQYSLEVRALRAG